MAAPAVVVRLSTMFRWISGMAIPTALTTRVPLTARITLRGYRQQYPARRAIQPRPRAVVRRALAGSPARPVVVSWSVLSDVFIAPRSTNVFAAGGISAAAFLRAGSGARGCLRRAVPGRGAEHDQHEQGKRDHVNAGAPQADRADGEKLRVDQVEHEQHADHHGADPRPAERRPGDPPCPRRI